MLRWGFGKGQAKKETAAEAVPQAHEPIDDELAFLRSRGDFDEEEMASVRSSSRPASPPPAPAEPAAEAGPAPKGDDWSFLRSRAREDGIASVFAPPVEVVADGAQAAAGQDPAPAPCLTAEDHRLNHLLDEARGVPPDLSDEDLRIGELLHEAMGYQPPDRQGE